MRGKLLPGLTILSSLALTGCGQERPVVAKPPVALLECRDEPVAPDLPGRDQQDARDQMTLDYLLNLRSAWGDCSSKVSGVKAWADSLND